MFNEVILIGNVGNDAEVKKTKDGKELINLSLATVEIWKDKNGEKQIITEWHKLFSFAPNIISLAQYIKKGSKIFIKGCLVSNQYKDKEGVEKKDWSIKVNLIKFLETKPKESKQSEEIEEDEIPF